MASPKNFITEDTTIKGNVTTASSLTVAGAVEGDINAGGDIDVMDDAVVKGDVSGPNVKINGKVEGKITASGRLVISGSGQVIGDIAVRSLLIEEGGTLQGLCKMGESAAVPAPALGGGGDGTFTPRPPNKPPRPQA